MDDPFSAALALLDELKATDPRKPRERRERDERILYEPSEETIRLETAMIRATWTDDEFERRIVGEVPCELRPTWFGSLD
jgi:hypothetical protein